MFRRRFDPFVGKGLEALVESDSKIKEMIAKYPIYEIKLPDYIKKGRHSFMLLDTETLSPMKYVQFPEEIDGNDIERYHNPEWGLAFWCRSMVYYAGNLLPSNRNTDWTYMIPSGRNWTPYGATKHTKSNQWHYQLRPDSIGGGDRYFGDRDKHPNVMIGSWAMNTVSSRDGCANGRGPDKQPDEPWLNTGEVLIRNAITKEPLVPPDIINCHICEQDLDWRRLARISASPMQELTASDVRYFNEVSGYKRYPR